MIFYSDIFLFVISLAVEVLVRLARVAEDALKKTGYFYLQVPHADGPDPLSSWSASL
jgi:hypothetical protein